MGNFKDLAKNLLIEREGTFSKCSTQCNLKEGVGAILKLAEMVKDDDLHEYGRETQPHVTVLYGITPNVSAKTNTQQALAKCGLSEIKARIGECSKFTNEAENFEVLKFEIISEDLHRLNKHLCNSVDYTTDYPDYNPHMTIAYVKRGCADKYINKIGKRLAGFPLKFSSVSFSDTDGTQEDMILGYPDNENAQHPDTGNVNEDLGYGAGAPSGNAYMSGHLGVYNSPVVKQNSDSFRSYKRYNMTNNNTVVAGGYYDTIFDVDVKKIMGVLKKLNFKTEWPSNDEDNEIHLSNAKRQDAVHQMSDFDANRTQTDDPMNDATGINISNETMFSYLRNEFGDDLKTMYKKQESPIVYDEVVAGLHDEMDDMQYPDKDFAVISVLKNLIRDQKYYSGLKKYDIHENVRDIYGTKFKPTEINKILKEFK